MDAGVLETPRRAGVLIGPTRPRGVCVPNTAWRAVPTKVYAEPAVDAEA